MAKITYLLGAGASANTIPIVADMYERMQEIYRHFYAIMDKYNKEDSYSISGFNQDLYHCLGTLSTIIYDDLAWLIKEAGSYYTIDTLAKKFYLTGDDKSLTRLKKCLITYFTLEQIIFIPSTKQKEYHFVKSPTDKRYSSFIAAITRKRYPIAGGNSDGLAAESLGFELSKDIKILSWNYDVQFELSVKSMLTGTIIEHIKSEFQIFPNKGSLIEVNNAIADLNRFAMVKLNGDAVWNRKAATGKENIPTIFDGLDPANQSEERLIDFLRAYAITCIDKKSDVTNPIPVMSFNFAWESDNNFRDKYQGHSKNLETAEQIAEDTEILVVIGYSFPIFNREIDNRLFKKMKKLKKVYVQDIEPERIQSTMQNAFEVLQKEEYVTKEGRRLASSVGVAVELDRIKKVDFQLESSINQFLIPYELNQ